MKKRISFRLLSALMLTMVGAFVFTAPVAAQSGGPSSTPTPPAPGGYSYPYGRSWGWGPGMWETGWSMYDGCGDYGWYDGSYSWGMMPRQGYGGYVPVQPVIPPTTTSDVSFESNVQPIFSTRCVSCHGGTRRLFLTDYDSVLRGSANGPVVIPGAPQNSRLIQHVVSGYMPYGGPPLTQAQIQILVNWVAAGAPNN